jgi:hypothetical protein
MLEYGMFSMAIMTILSKFFGAVADAECTAKLAPRSITTIVKIANILFLGQTVR